jgi:hypothetical protein
MRVAEGEKSNPGEDSEGRWGRERDTRCHKDYRRRGWHRGLSSEDARERGGWRRDHTDSRRLDQSLSRGRRACSASSQLCEGLRRAFCLA